MSPKPLPAPHIYDLIIIGRGTAAAIYLNTLPAPPAAEHRVDAAAQPISNLPPLSILVIGEDDPWSAARGHHENRYSKNINQAEQLIEHGRGWSASVSMEPVDRLEFAKSNAEIIAKVARENVLTATVTKVKKNKDGDYLVETNHNAAGFIAKKIVIATGAGIERSDLEYHAVPSELRELVDAKEPGVMDLDQFQNQVDPNIDGTGKAIAILGPIAGTDAVMEASTRNYAKEEVYWLIKGNTGAGLANTWPDPYAPGDVRSRSFTKAEAESCIKRFGERGLKVERVTGPKPLKVTLNKEDPFYVDYFVYAVGQFGGGILRTAKYNDGTIRQIRFVSKKIVFEPIYDVNQAFGSIDDSKDAADPSGAWQHVLGLQSCGSTKTSGIIIIGAAAAQSARIAGGFDQNGAMVKVSHNYLDNEYSQTLHTVALPNISFSEIAKSVGFTALNEWATFDSAQNITKNLSIDDKILMESSYKEKIRDFLARIESETANDVNAPQALKAGRYLCDLFLWRLRATKYYLSNNWPSVLDMLNKGLSRTLPETMYDSRLIGGMQRNIAALNGHENFKHILTLSGTNFMEKQQELALYVAHQYPNISKKDANQLVRNVIQNRKNKNNNRGFSTTDIRKYEADLILMDIDARMKSGVDFESFLNE